MQEGKQIDWSWAPEGADKYDTHQGMFYRGERPNLAFFDHSEGRWRPSNLNAGQEQFVHLPVKHAAWTGSGLPPVGTVCEIAASTEYLNIRHPEGAQVKIYAHFTDDRGIELAAFVDDHGKVGGVAVSGCFRPIRTPEQIAAEKREAGIAAIKAIADAAIRRNESAAAAVYDAGYRLPKGEA